MSAITAPLSPPAPRNVRWNRVGIVLIVVLLAVALRSLEQLPMLGMADNGDSWRVRDSVGLAPAKANTKRTVQREFLYVAPQIERLLSSTALIAGTARLWFGRLHPEGPFDLRALGLTYWTILAVCLAYALQWRVSVPLLLLWLWIVVDPEYLLLFNSFYTEPLLLLSVIGVCVIVVSGAWERRWPFAAMCVLVLFGAITKLPYVLLPLTLAAAVGIVCGRTRRVQLTVLATIACLPLTIFFIEPTGAMRDLARMNSFNAVFFGVAKASRFPRVTMERLGIPATYHVFRGRHYFETPRDSYGGDLDDALARISRWRILAGYAQLHALKYTTVEVAKNMADSRTHLSHVEQSAGFTQHLVRWRFNRFRDAVLQDRGWLVMLLLAAAAAWIVATWRRTSTRVRITAVFLWLTVISQAVVNVLGDGLYGLERHMILARFAADLLYSLIIVDMIGSAEDVLHRA